MVESLKNRVKSQRGASLSFALFVFLVCAMASAAVLAAATTAVGQYADLGSYDQRYYSVTSAASLFRGPLSLDDEVAYTYVEQRTGTYDERTANAEPSYGSIALVQAPSSAGAFDFLAEVSECALFGQSSRVVAGTTELGNAWREPFEGDRWASGYVDFTYQIAPALREGGDATALAAEAKVRVHTNWLVEVVVSNKVADADKAAEQFSLYMAFQGTCDQRIRALDEKLGNTESSGGKAKNVATVTERRTTEVTWQLVQLSPGGGFASNG